MRTTIFKTILVATLPVFVGSVTVADTGFKPITIAVIDTGFDFSLSESKFLCKVGHKDFTNTSISDNHGHGTHVSTVIHQHVTHIYLNESSSLSEQYHLLHTKMPYCQLILKYYDPSSKVDSLQAEIEAFEYAIKMKVDMINFSSAGKHLSAIESVVIKKALDAGIKIVVAAGNAAANIDVEPYYPAVLDPRLNVVGNLNKEDIRAPTSNYGEKVNTWEHGTEVYSMLPEGKLGKLSGTSQAAAVKSGKIIRELLSKRLKEYVSRVK